MSSPQTSPVQDEPPADEASPFALVTAPPGPPRRRRRWWLVAGAVAVLALAGAGYASADRFAALGAYRYETPEEFNGVPADTDGPLLKRVRSDVASGAAGPRAFAASYGTPSTGYVMVMGYQRHDFMPSWSLDDAIKKAAASPQQLPAMQDADPGPRGGAMRCALQPSEMPGGFPHGMCLWADGSMQAMFSEFGTSRSLDLGRVEADARAFRLLAEQPA